MENIGQGIIYTHFGNHKRNELTEEEKKHILSLRTEHLNRLTNALEEDSIIIDCHSFNGKSEDCDICIGYNDDDIFDEETIKIITDASKKYNYRVEFNKPYSNSISPLTDKKYKSVMIEVNKRLYLYNVDQLDNNKFHWIRWYGCIKKLYDALLKK